jgi:phosphohistidine swiveling domain-containing protein
MAVLAVTNDFTTGTTIVAADVNQNFTDVESFVNTTPGLLQNSLVDVKGDLLVATADNTIARLPAGTDDYVLVADSTDANGVKWAASAAGTVTSVTGTSPIVSSGGATPAISVTTNDAQLILNNTVFN